VQAGEEEERDGDTVGGMCRWETVFQVVGAYCCVGALGVSVTRGSEKLLTESSDGWGERPWGADQVFDEGRSIYP